MFPLIILSIDVTLFVFLAAVISANTPQQAFAARLILIGLALAHLGAMVAVVS